MVNKRLSVLFFLLIRLGIAGQNMEISSLGNNNFIQKTIENGENIQITCSDLYNKRFISIRSTDSTSAWNQSFDISKSTRIVDLITIGNSDLYLTGYEKYNSKEYNIKLFHINKNDGLIFDKAYETKGLEIPSKLIKTLDDKLIIGGFSAQSNESYYTILTNDIHLLKIEPNGNRIWSKTIGLKKIDEELLDITITPDNEILVVAKRKFFKEKIYITKINKFGNISWQSDFEIGHFISSAEIKFSNTSTVTINASILDLDKNYKNLYNKEVTLIINPDGEKLAFHENSINKLDHEISDIFAFSSESKIRGIVKSNSLNIRNNPTLTSSVVVSITKGDVVEILDKSEAPVRINNMNEYWYYLKVNENDTGWAYGYFLEVVD